MGALALRIQDAATGIVTTYAVPGEDGFNGDGIDDLIVGTGNAGSNGQDRTGQSYGVFGRDSGFPAAVDVSSLDGTTGFTLNGIDPDDGVFGVSVASAGDFNTDGVHHLLMSVSSPRFTTGETYVAFGSGQGTRRRWNSSRWTEQPDSPSRAST